MQVIERLEQAVEGALDHFGLALREDTTANDLACALASMVEGVWLNQCLTDQPPVRPGRADRHRAAALRPAAVARRDPPAP